MITPKKSGFMQLKVSATSPFSEDGIQTPLLVMAEGETQYKNKPAIFNDL